MIGMKPIVFPALLLSLLGTARADHCPEKFIAPGPAEHQIAGIDVTKDRIGRAIEVLGPPTRQKMTPDPDGPPGSGEGEYVWENRNAYLTLATAFYVDKGDHRVESVYSGNLESTGAGPYTRLKTGRGATLGMSVKQLRGIYGDKFLKNTLSAKPTITFCFEDDTMLYFILDRDEKVVEIQVLASAE